MENEYFVTVACPYKNEKEECSIFGNKCSFYKKCNHKLNCNIVYKEENRTCNGKNL